MFEYTPAIEMDPMEKWIVEAKSKPIVAFLALSMVDQQEVSFKSRGIQFDGIVTNISTTCDQYVLAVELDHMTTFKLNLRYLDEWEITQR